MKKFKIHAIASYLSEAHVHAETRDEAWCKAQDLKDVDFKDIRQSRSLEKVDLHEVIENGE